jgi:hypothetical protein
MKRRRGNRPKMAPDDVRRKNLIPPARKGEVRNPTGRNGSERLREFQAFADEVISIAQARGKPELKGTRAQLARLAWFENVLRGDSQAQKLFIEQLQGRARQSIELTGEGGGPVKTDTGAAVIEMLQKLAGEKG